ncbi:MAG: YtfJ family protein [Thermodesulfovibrionales bacterium]
MIIFPIIMLLFIFFPIGVESGQSIALNTKAPDFSLKDQYDRTFNLREFEGQVVVLIASDKEGSAQNHLWGRKIRERYGNKIIIIGMADLRSVPFFLKNKIKEDFKKDDNSILLDWSGKVFDAYELAKKVSNIIVIDKKGYVRFTYSGSATKEAVNCLFEAIDDLSSSLE